MGRFALPQLKLDAQGKREDEIMDASWIFLVVIITISFQGGKIELCM